MNCRTIETDDPDAAKFMAIEVKEKDGLGLVIAEIDPEDTPADVVASVSVRTEMPVPLPAVADPIVRPPRVMMTAVEAPIPTPPMAMMILPAGADGVATMPGTDDAKKVGVAVGEKKSEG